MSQHVENSIYETSSSFDKEKKSKKIGLCWSSEEDRKLLEAVECYGEKRWVDVARAVGTRSRKQCRERFVNHISPKIVKKPWTPEEDEIILRSYGQFGNKWSEIGRRLNGRTARSVRNRYRALTAKQNMSCFNVVDKNAYTIIMGGAMWM